MSGTCFPPVEMILQRKPTSTRIASQIAVVRVSASIVLVEYKSQPSGFVFFFRPEAFFCTTRIYWLSTTSRCLHGAPQMVSRDRSKH
jgi:hypothetical protein